MDAGEGKFIFFSDVTHEKTTHAAGDGPAPTNAHTGSAKGTQCLSVCLSVLNSKYMRLGGNSG